MIKKTATGNYFFYLLFCTSLVMSWYFHKDSARFIDRYELWSDRAGYYIYLPATFYYGFDARKLPADLDMKTGGGFSIDTARNKIDTKYTYGVALMLSPFFAAAHLVSRITGYHDLNGFSLIYLRFMMLAAVIYLMLGLWLLHLFLRHYFPRRVIFPVLLLTLFGTNLFYYTLIDGMMSHVYSFFLFSLFLFSLQRYLATDNFRYFIVLSVALAIATLIRPTDIILGLSLFFLDIKSRNELFTRFQNILKPKPILVILLILLILFLPQMIYWKYLSGHWLHFSYQGEGFTNWRNPRFAEVLFSPVNGLISYTPLVLFMLAGMVIMVIRKKQNRWLIIALFGLVTLVCASWKMWYFGCSFGQRSYIEYFTILAIPLGWFITMVTANRNFLLKTLLIFLLMLTVYANIRYTTGYYRFDRCYYGSTWDWDFYRRTYERAGVISPVHSMSSYRNDFENMAIYPVLKPSHLFTHSGQYSVYAGGDPEKTPLFTAHLYEFGYPWPKQFSAEAWIMKLNTRETGACLGFAAIRGDRVVFSDSVPLDSLLKQPLNWTRISKNFIIPDFSDSSLTLKLYIANPLRKPLFADDLSMSFSYSW